MESKVQIVLVPGECNENGDVLAAFCNFEFEHAKVKYDYSWIVVEDTLSNENIFMAPRESVYFVRREKGE